ncbi:MAG: hypothetical protein FWF30_02630 [Coriobacteriia bacterium]|nr:hypothetical protein [Coriobacteriia bacterium]
MTKPHRLFMLPFLDTAPGLERVRMESKARADKALEDHRRLIEAARADGDDEAGHLLVLGLCFGLRKGEILGLDWQGVDLEAGVFKMFDPPRLHQLSSRLPIVAVLACQCFLRSSILPNRLCF